MPHQQPIDIVCDLQDEPIDIRKWALVASNLAHDKGADATKTGQIQTLGLVENEISNTIGKAAAEVAHKRVLLIVVIGIDHLSPGLLRKSQQALHLFRGVLQVIVHGDDMSTSRMPQPSHHRIVLPIVAREVNECNRYTCLIDQFLAHFETVVWASIIDQYNFVGALDRKFLDRANQFGYAARPVINPGSDRQSKTACRVFGMLLCISNHDRCLSGQWQSRIRRKAVLCPSEAVQFLHLSRFDTECLSDECTV